jgi:hypothetical protein
MKLVHWVLYPHPFQFETAPVGQNGLRRALQSNKGL